MAQVRQSLAQIFSGNFVLARSAERIALVLPTAAAQHGEQNFLSSRRLTENGRMRYSGRRAFFRKMKDEKMKR